MLSFRVKFVQTDRQMDTGKTICPLIFDTGPQKYMSTKNGGCDRNRQFKPLPHMPILGSSNSTAKKNMMLKIWTNGGYNDLI